MVLLAREDIATREVLDWQGMHLLHFAGSTCSKKIRIFLDYKHIDWVSHPINLVKRENTTDWFMGINPRGLVPVLVHDGQVHIESNDILDYLERLYPEPPMIPAAQAAELAELLRTEDDLHMDLRRLTLRFTAPSRLMQRSKAQLEHYATAGTGLVGGEPDPHKAEELDFWRDFSTHQGITDSEVVDATARFRQALDELETRVEHRPYLLGNTRSLADIAWFITVNRILLAGYPLRRLHPGLWEWRRRLLQHPAFSREAKAPLLQTVSARVIGCMNTLKRKTLSDVAGV